MKNGVLGAIMFAGAVAATPASATTFLFSINGGAAGSGSIETLDTPNSGGGYTITDISGVVVGLNIVAGPINFLGADNILYAYNDPTLSFDGMSFRLAGGTRVNIYYGADSYRFASLNIFTGVTREGTLDFAVTPEAAVPEAATWAMMIAGFGLTGAALRRRTTVRFAVAV